jgi:predicted ATP-grasp superfamily ATP-dependent carboligase
MPHDTIPVLLLGEGLTLLGAVRCFGRAGIPAYVLTGPDPLARHSRWFRTLPSHELAHDAYEELPALLRELPMERGVLVPCSDHWVAAVAALDEDIRKRFPAVCPSEEVIDLFIDKGGFARLLEKLDIPHPRTFDLEQPDSLATVPEDVLAAGFLKPRDSMAFVGAFCVKAFDFKGRDEAEALLQRAEDAGQKMLLQEYIPGGPDQHYFVDGYVDRQGKLIVRFARRRYRIFPPRFGNSTAVESVPLEEAREAVEAIEKLAEQAGLRGIFSAEFKRDSRDQRFKLIEVNARPWWYIEFAATCGADVCEPAYREMVGQALSTQRPYRVGVRLICPYQDWRAWRELPPGTTSLRKLLAFWAGATQARWRPDDPLPALFSASRDGRGWLARRASRRGRSSR